MKLYCTLALLFLMGMTMTAQNTTKYEKELMQSPFAEQYLKITKNQFDSLVMLHRECTEAFGKAGQEEAEAILIVQNKIARDFSMAQQLRFSDSLLSASRRAFLENGFDSMNYAFGDMYMVRGINSNYLYPSRQMSDAENAAKIWQVLNDPVLNATTLIELVNTMPRNQATEKRLSLLDSAIRMCDRNGLTFYKSVAQALKGQFISYFDPFFAREILMESLATLNSMERPNYAFMSVIYSMIAGIYRDLGKEYVDEQIYWYSQKEQLIAQHGIFSPPRQLELYLNFFDSYLELPDYQNAQRCLDSIDLIFTRYLDSTHLYYPEFVYRQGKLKIEQDSLETARQFIERSLRFNNMWDNFMLDYNACNALGEIAYRSGDLQKALELTNRSIFMAMKQQVAEDPLSAPDIPAIESGYISIVPADIKNKILLLREMYEQDPQDRYIRSVSKHYHLLTEYYERFMISALSMDETLMSYSQKLDKISAEILEWFNSIGSPSSYNKEVWELVSANKANQLYIQKLKTKNPDSKSEEENLQQQLNLEIRELNIAMEELDSGSTEHIRLKQQWMAKNQHLLMLQIKSEENSPEAELHHKVFIAANELMENIPAGEKLLDYYFYDSVLYRFDVDAHSIHFHHMEPGFPLKQAILQAFRKIKTGSRPAPDESRKLSETLFAGLEGNGRHKFIIIPDKSLLLLPFEILPYPADGEKMLIESTEIVYNYSPVFYRESLLAGKGKAESILISAPGFDNGENAMLASSSPYRDAEASQFEELLIRDKGHLKLAPLPRTIDESKSIDEMFRKAGFSSRVFLNDDASEEAIRKNIADYDIIHIATHGIASRSSTSNTGLFFSQKNTGGYDGFLRMNELFTLDLQASLVVLSACKTAYGDITEGEGIMALPRGFLFAGATEILASLWKIHDEHSMNLMIDFYSAYLAGAAYSEALRIAKMKALENESIPLNWAGFILIGY